MSDSSADCVSRRDIMSHTSCLIPVATAILRRKSHDVASSWLFLVTSRQLLFYNNSHRWNSLFDMIFSFVHIILMSALLRCVVMRMSELLECSQYTHINITRMCSNANVRVTRMFTLYSYLRYSDV